jgi:hypothetical protein
MRPHHKITLDIGTPQPSSDPVRAVLGEVTARGKALAQVLAAHEAELSEFLQDPKNREALAKDPLKALSHVLPGDVLKRLGQPARIPPDLQKKLQRVTFRPRTKLPSPALELFNKAWAHVSASAANFTTFNADMNGTLRQIDPKAPTPVVNEVIAAFDGVRGIHQLNLGVSSGYFSGKVQDTLNQAQSPLVRWPR